VLIQTRISGNLNVGCTYHQLGGMALRRLAWEKEVCDNSTLAVRSKIGRGGVSLVLIFVAIVGPLQMIDPF